MARVPIAQMGGGRFLPSAVIRPGMGAEGVIAGADVLLEEDRAKKRREQERMIQELRDKGAMDRVVVGEEGATERTGMNIGSQERMSQADIAASLQRLRENNAFGRWQTERTGEQAVEQIGARTAGQRQVQDAGFAFERNYRMPFQNEQQRRGIAGGLLRFSSDIPNDLIRTETYGRTGDPGGGFNFRPEFGGEAQMPGHDELSMKLKTAGDPLQARIALERSIDPEQNPQLYQSYLRMIEEHYMNAGGDAPAQTGGPIANQFSGMTSFPGGSRSIVQNR